MISGVVIPAQVLVVSAGLGFWWWTFIALELFFLFVCSDRDWGLAGIFSLIVTSFALSFWSDLNIFSVMYHHPVWFVLAVILSFVIGIWWTWFKWKLFVLKGKEDFEYRASARRQRYLEELRNEKNTQYSDEVKVRLIQELERGRIPDEFLADFHSHVWLSIPSWTNNKDRIASWLMLWPWSMLWYFISDFIRDIGRKIIARFHTIYEKVVADAYKDIDPRLISRDD